MMLSAKKNQNKIIKKKEQENYNILIFIVYI